MSGLNLSLYSTEVHSKCDSPPSSEPTLSDYSRKEGLIRSGYNNWAERARMPKPTL